MNRSLLSLSVLVFVAGLALAVGGCTYYQVAPGVYATTPSNYDRAWSAALGALEDEGVTLMNVDRAAGKASGSRGSISVTALVRSRADSSVQVEFRTSGNTASDPALIDRITRSYNYRMGR